MDTLVLRVGHRQQRKQVVEGNQSWRSDGGTACCGNRDDFLGERRDKGRVLLRDTENQILAYELDGVE